jgi:2-hydroxychromene-2-carboxylate isomerase
LQDKRREEEKPTMRALHNTERRELSEIKTRRAVEIGTFGAPSFVVGKERF